MSPAKKTTPKVKASALPAAKKTPGPKPEEGRRQTRQKRISAELIAAGTAMFRDKGFEMTTVADIAEQVGISRRTFFRYFKAKDDLVFKWIDEQGTFVIPMLASRPTTESPFTAMQQTFIALAERHDSEPERVRFLTKLIFDTPSLEGRYHGEHAKWEREFVRVFKHGRRYNAVKSFALQAQVAACITVFVVAIRTWAADRHETPLRPWMEAAFAALAEGAKSMPS